MIYPTDNYYQEGSFIIVLDEATPLSFIQNNRKWATGNEKHNTNKYVSTKLTDQEFEKLSKDYEIMKTAEDYSEYKKALSRFCYFCNIAPRGLLIKKCILKKGKEGSNENSIEVEYINNSKKIALPEGAKLFHMTKVEGIKELIPQFRGKSVKGYLYDKPRVYFTIRKNMPKFLADYKPNEKMHMYLCKKNFDQVYVDPLVWSYLQGAVYVETTTPIPVEELTKENKDKLLGKSSKEDNKKEEQQIEEGFDFDNFFKFVTENGLQLINDDNDINNP